MSDSEKVIPVCNLFNDSSASAESFLESAPDSMNLPKQEAPSVVENIVDQQQPEQQTVKTGNSAGSNVQLCNMFGDAPNDDPFASIAGSLKTAEQPKEQHPPVEALVSSVAPATTSADVVEQVAAGMSEMSLETHESFLTTAVEPKTDTAALEAAAVEPAEEAALHLPVEVNDEVKEIPIQTIQQVTTEPPQPQMASSFFDSAPSVKSPFDHLLNKFSGDTGDCFK